MRDIRAMKLLIAALICICTACNAFAQDDWTYELSSEAKHIYKEKITQYPCTNIPALIRKDKAADLYYTIRDAGLFRAESCDPFIQRNMSALSDLPGVKNAIAFYYYRLGDKRQLNVLVSDFDDSASADDCTVELFGYLDDWDASGVRLVRLAANADSSGAELLCSTIMWRRYLYGEEAFKENWYRIGAREKIDRRLLDHFYETCGVEP